MSDIGTPNTEGNLEAYIEMGWVVVQGTLLRWKDYPFEK